MTDDLAGVGGLTMWDVALSTMWGVGQFERLADFFSTGEALGFRRFELNHGVDSAMLNGVELNDYQVVSLHEPCPADLSPATLSARNWLISAPDEDRRQQGVAAVQRSINLAHQLGARLVVVHPGRVDMDPQYERALHELYTAGQLESPIYAEAKERMVAARAAQAQANLQAVRRSLAELAAYAGRRGVQLGLENRYHYYEIPLPDELELLLDGTPDGVVGFVHDVGHAQKQENLGLCRHEEWLRRFAGRLVGVHLHDINGLSDHLAPGQGQIDWDMVASLLPAGVKRTCECRNDIPRQELVDGMRFLAGKGCL